MSFGIPQEALYSFLNEINGYVPSEGYLRITGIDVNGNTKCYCFSVDQTLQWQIILQIGACMGPQAFWNALNNSSSK